MQFGIAIKSLTIDKAKRSNLSMIDKHPTAYLCCQLKSEPLEGSTYSDISTATSAKVYNRGQWCGSVGRAVASNFRGPRIKSCHQQNLNRTFTVNCIERTEIIIKRLRKAYFKRSVQQVEKKRILAQECILLLSV